MPFSISAAQAQNMFSNLNLTIGEPVGTGGFKVVFDAFNSNGEHFALKIIDPEKADLNRLHREALAMEQIDSPFVPKVFEWGLGDRDRYPYLLEEFIDGVPLSRLLYEDKVTFTDGETVSFLDQLLIGLSACAEQEIVHRDIKPQNIMIRDDGTPVIIDFGQSRHLDMTSLTSDQGPIPAFTLLWAPPEIINYSKEDIDETSDLFSIGIVAYEMLTGTHPFCGDISILTNYLEAKQLMLSEDAVPVCELADVPGSLSNYVSRLIRREKFRRFRSVEHARDQLARI